ncbi:hypothetical protein M9H77_36709 [Catharanthus roseus]|uniref:Uncharacterized protein n=1 Tax=Catharanthus roseus TaxID=4058 RepID=A0ACB9ZSL2_CATRO|nr:hypothetical protein M9H77_36709 [Catharanthus roseus]
MFYLVCKNFPRNFGFFQWNQLSTLSRKPLSSTVKIDAEKNLVSFTVNYLVKKLGFPPERAALVSKSTNFQTPEKPDSVILFLKDEGFTHDQIQLLIKEYPRFILCDPKKTLLPKIEFFRSLGFPDVEITETLCARPEILKRSLKKQLKPSFEFLKDLFSLAGKTLIPLKWYTTALCSEFQTCLVPSVEILREFGVPDNHIVTFLKIKSKTFPLSGNKFRKIVEEVKDMGFNPSRMNFVVAVHIVRGFKKSSWKKKVEVYKKWGCSEAEILEAFGKYPWCMALSDDKIMAKMEFLVSKFGLSPSDVLRQPKVTNFSLQHRIFPRSVIYQALSKKELVPKDFRFWIFLEVSEEKFLQRFVEPFQDEAPELLALYQKALPL